MPLDCMPRCNLRIATARVMNHVSLRDQTVVNYRETVLTGFQQVKDNLAALRILENEALVQEKAVVAAQKYLELANTQSPLVGRSPKRLRNLQESTP